MVGRLVSFWDPAYSQGLAVSFREGIFGCVRKFRCQQSVLHGGYDSEVCFEVCFGGMIRGMIRPTFFSVYINTISYIKGLSPTPSWRPGLFSEGADWAMAQQSEVWV